MLNGKTLNNLKITQKKLDQLIFQTHHQSYQKTFQKRKVAFLIEMAEFMNETRVFKFWSFKPPSCREVLLEEYVDGLHFLLSLANDLTINFEEFYYYNLRYENLEQWYFELSDQFLLFHNVNIEENYFKVVNIFLNAAEILHFQNNEIISSYYLKQNTNYQRQKEAY